MFNILEKLLNTVRVSEYTLNNASILLLCERAKTGRGDGITGSGVAAPFLLPLKRIRLEATERHIAT